MTHVAKNRKKISSLNIENYLEIMKQEMYFAYHSGNLLDKYPWCMENICF